MTHHVSNKQLKAIDAGIPSILIATGDEDNLVKPSNSLHLKNWLPSARFELLKGRGHALQLQDAELLNRLLAENYSRGWEKSAGNRDARNVPENSDARGDDLPSSKLGTKQYWDKVYE